MREVRLCLQSFGFRELWLVCRSDASFNIDNEQAFRGHWKNICSVNRKIYRILNHFHAYHATPELPSQLKQNLYFVAYLILVLSTTHLKNTRKDMGIIQSIADEIMNDLGYPASVKSALRDMPEICATISTPARSIDEESIIKWQEMNAKSISGWRTRGGYYESFQVETPALASLTRKTITENWCCDLSEIQGFRASKSDLAKFHTTDEMVERNSKEMIEEITHENLQQNLAHEGIHLWCTNQSSANFRRYAWDGRLFLANSGGSHHVAAAKYIATRLQEKVPLFGKLIEYSFDQFAVATLRSEFEMLVVSDHPAPSNAFHDAMRRAKVTWLWLDIPRNQEAKIVFLPKNEVRSMRVARLLSLAGCQDAGALFTSLAAR